MGSIKCSRNTSFSFFLIFFVLFVIAFGTRYWYVYKILESTYHRGLWQACVDIQIIDDVECENFGFNIEDFDGLITGTQITMCVSLGLYFISFICYCVWMSRSQQFLDENGAGSSGKAALSFALSGGLVNLTAVAQFGAYHTEEADHLHYSYYLAVSSCVVMSLNSIITLSKTACCFKGQRSSISPTVISTTAPPHFGAVTVITTGQIPQSYPMDQVGYTSTQAYPSTGYPGPQPSGYPAAGAYTNPGYNPEQSSAQQPYPQQYPVVQPSAMSTQPPAYNPYLQNHSVPLPDYAGHDKLGEPKPDMSFEKPSTYM